jgi:hypothetical protein
MRESAKQPMVKAANQPAKKHHTTSGAQTKPDRPAILAKKRADSKSLPVTRRIIRTHPGLFVALFTYLFLAFSFFFIVPIFEGPDEWTHTGHVKYLAEGHGLPVMWPGQGIWGGQQPPLYYAGGALLVQPFELAGVADYEENRRNPHASIGYALDPGNKNNYLHRPSERFPYRGLSLTVHVLRLYSMAYGLVAIIFIYLTALEFYRHYNQEKATRSLFLLPGGHAHLFATAVALFVACQPMFDFITASVANEPANIAFCSLGLWLAQRYILYGPNRHWGRAAALGLTLGLISLSKMTGLAFGLAAVVAILITATATRKKTGAARLLWRDGLIIGLLFLAVGGWWYWRNYQLYGDFFQQGLYKIYFNVDPQPLTLDAFLYTLSTGEVSFWATFGWLNIAAPEWVYTVYYVISRVGLVGLTLALGMHLAHRMRRQDKNEIPAERPPLAAPTSIPSPPGPPASRFPPALILHLVFPVTLAFSLTRLVAIEGGLQGRQLLPAVGSLAILIMWGWWVLTPTRFRLPVIALVLAGLFGLAVWLPYGVVAAAYIPEPLLTEADLPADLNRLGWVYRDEMKLIGVNIGTDLVHPGEQVPVTAYWQALKPMETNYSVFVHLIGRDYTPVGQMNSYPGLGLRPTASLQPGQIVVDTYPVRVEGGSQAPTRLRVNIGLFDFEEPGRPGIPPISATGPPPASPTVGQLKLVPHTWPPTEEPPLAQFADNIRLVDYTLESCGPDSSLCQVILKWSAQAQPAADYTVFIHLWRKGQFVTGFDAPPLGNDYPTSMWAAGEVIIDPHPLDLTPLLPGDYQLKIGLYNPATGDRLPVSASDSPVPDHALPLGTITVN